MLAKLGSFKFELDTAAYDKLARTTQYKWAKQGIFGERQSLQFTGIGEEKITLSGVIYAEYKGGLGQIDRMREMAGKGELLPLATGYGNVGKVFGNWAIERINEEQSYFHSNGQPKKQTFNLEISRHG